MVDDLGLVERALRDDEAAFELLVRRHAEAVWRLASSLLADRHDAEEAVQDTFLKAFRHLDSFRAESSFRTWLHSICHRTCLDRLRSPRAQVVPLEEIRERRDAEGTPELRLALKETLEGLPSDERRAFVLVHVLGYSREEAAEICGVPASTMRSRVLRARQRLAQAMERSEFVEGDG